MLVNEEAGRHYYLMDSEKLTWNEKQAFSELLERKMEKSVLSGSLKLMSRLLEKHHGQKVIILIDEYDVPLARAHAQGYYDEMIVLIRSLFHQTLKTNISLQFAILTGCMRICKESIFTGLNNLNVLTITDVRLDECFGFIDKDVKKLLDYYGLSDKYSAVKEWYDGYQFVSSNREAGDGYADILVEIDDDNEPMGIVIEVKYARDGNPDAACLEALRQIEQRNYGGVFLIQIS